MASVLCSHAEKFVCCGCSCGRAKEPCCRSTTAWLTELLLPPLPCASPGRMNLVRKKRASLFWPASHVNMCLSYQSFLLFSSILFKYHWSLSAASAEEVDRSLPAPMGDEVQGRWSERCLHPCRWPYLQMPARWSFIHLTHVGNSSFPMQWDFGPQKPWTSKHTETWHTEVKPKSSSPNSLYMMVLSSVAWHLMRERKPQGIKMYISYKMTLGNQRVCWWFRAKEWHLSERKGMLCSEKAGFHSAGIVITYLVNKW